MLTPQSHVYYEDNEWYPADLLGAPTFGRGFTWSTRNLMKDGKALQAMKNGSITTTYARSGVILVFFVAPGGEVIQASRYIDWNSIRVGSDDLK